MKKRTTDNVGNFLFLKRSLSCLDTWPSGSVFLLLNFNTKSNSILLRIADLCLEMSSDSKCYFGFVFAEIFELGHTLKSRCFVL